MPVHLSCPKCDRKIMDRQDNGTLRIRARLVLVPDLKGGIQALCPQCKEFVLLPLRMEYLSEQEGTTKILNKTGEKS